MPINSAAEATQVDCDIKRNQNRPGLFSSVETRFSVLNVEKGVDGGDDPRVEALSIWSKINCKEMSAVHPPLLTPVPLSTLSSEIAERGEAALWLFGS